MTGLLRLITKGNTEKRGVQRAASTSQQALPCAAARQPNQKQDWVWGFRNGLQDPERACASVDDFSCRFDVGLEQRCAGANADARHHHRRCDQDRRKGDRHARPGQYHQPERDPDDGSETPARHFLSDAGRDLPGSRRFTGILDQHSRPAGFRPRRGRDRRRAAELPALRPQRQRLVLPRAGTARQRRRGTRPDREYLRFRRDRRRGVVPDEGRAGYPAAGRKSGHGGRHISRK